MFKKVDRRAVVTNVVFVCDVALDLEAVQQRTQYYHSEKDVASLYLVIFKLFCASMLPHWW